MRSGTAARRSSAGFTMIEILVVIGVIVILTGLIIVGVQHARFKAKLERTKAILEAIKTALGAYNAEFRDFPPDGYGPDGSWNVSTSGADRGVMCPDGIRRRGSACLVYFLTERIANRRFIGADTGGSTTSDLNTVVRAVGPFLIDDALDTTNYSRVTTAQTHHGPPLPGGHEHGPGEPDVRDFHCEIVDAFGFPIHYDKVGTGGTMFSAFFDAANHRTIGHVDDTLISGEVTAIMRGDSDQAGTRRCPGGGHAIPESTSSSASLDGSFDPRRPLHTTNADGCVNTGVAAAAKNVGSYDLWSHGPTWNNPRDDITNWR